MTRDEMLEIMPHRGRNVLVDDFVDVEGGGRAELRVAEGDSEGRDLFLVRAPEGSRYSSFFLVEHAALNSVLVLRDEMGGGRLAYFSAVSGFHATGTAPAGSPLVSRVSRGRDRRGFRSFEVRVETAAGAPLLGCTFMAFLAPRGETPESREEPVSPSVLPAPEPGRFPCLHPSLAFVGGPDEEGRYGAVFPAGHPIAEGHFPGAPVMMGMAQWLAVAERAALWAPEGASVVEGSGGLSRLDGTAVVDVKGLAVSVLRDAGSVLDIRLLGTRKVSFRDRIQPGDAYVVEFEPETGRP